MKFNRFTVSFEGQDMYFLKKYGLFKAARMVKKHYKKHSTPFINDTYQLANELRIFHKEVFELSKRHLSKVPFSCYNKNYEKGIFVFAGSAAGFCSGWLPCPVVG